MSLRESFGICQPGLVWTWEWYRCIRTCLMVIPCECERYLSTLRPGCTDPTCKLRVPGHTVGTAHAAEPRGFFFRIRQQFALKALLCGWHHAPADELVRQITEYHRIRRHDAVVDAVLLAALDANLIACREVAKHFECLYGLSAYMVYHQVHSGE